MKPEHWLKDGRAAEHPFVCREPSRQTGPKVRSCLVGVISTAEAGYDVANGYLAGGGQVVRLLAGEEDLGATADEVVQRHQDVLEVVHLWESHVGWARCCQGERPQCRVWSRLCGTRLAAAPRDVCLAAVLAACMQSMQACAARLSEFGLCLRQSRCRLVTDA